jgi:hypothetical protein
MSALKRIVYVVFLLLWTTTSQGQISVGKFITDSIQVGKPIFFSLSIKHRPDLEILFPDTNAIFFKPFECKSLQFFPTRTDPQGSLDSAVYELVSFEVEPIQYLSLPVYVYASQDCTAVMSNRDSIFLNQKSQFISQLQVVKDFVPLQTQTNYPLVGFIILGFFVLIVLIAWLFGKNIRRQWERYLLWRNYREFKNDFEDFIKNKKNDAIVNTEKALNLWKMYMGRLEKKPLYTFTTRELSEYFKNQDLADALRTIDGIVYGGLDSPKRFDSLMILRYLAREIYRKKIADIKKQL